MESNSLANLKDLQLPDAVSIFPLAPAWYGVIIGVILLMAALGYWQMRRLTHQRRVASIVELLTLIEQQNSSQTLGTQLLAEVAILLKRVAREKFPEQQPQNLFGEPWLQFLDSSGKTTQFTQGAGRVLLEVYQNKPLENPQALFDVVRAWLKVVL